MFIFPSNEVSILGLSFTLRGSNLGVKGAAIATCIAIVTSLGVKALESHYLAIQAESITYIPTFGFATVATTLIAQAIGAKKINLAKKYARNSLIMGTHVMSIVGLFLFIFAHGLVSFFSNNVEVIESDVQFLRIVVIFEPFFG